MSNTYNPFEHLNAKGLWDQHLSNITETDKWLDNCRTIVGQWWISKFIDKDEFTTIVLELRSLCNAAGLDYLCIHCSSRPTKHDCKNCNSK
jgi:hypothetical protein